MDRVLAPLAFVDTETTGLDPDRHEIWEVGLLLESINDDGVREHQAYQWQLPVDLGRADPVALRIGRFHERRRADDQLYPLTVFARDFAGMTRGCHLVGAVPSFDEERLRKLLRSNGACPEWHYHLVDVEALVAGKLGIEPPWDSDELSRAVGVEPDEDARHTALGDARWAHALYRAVFA